MLYRAAATATTCGTRLKYNMPSCLMLCINYEDASKLYKTRATSRNLLAVYPAFKVLRDHNAYKT